MTGAIVETIYRSDMATFGVAVANGLVNRRENGASLHHAPTFILERLELFLRVRREGETGRIVSDMMRRGTRKRASRVFASATHGHNRLCHVRTERIRGMECASSLACPMIRLADGAARVIRRRMGGDMRFAGMFERLNSRMWREGKRDGWKVPPR